MKQATDKRFNRFLKSQRQEIEPSIESIERIRALAAQKVKTVEARSFNWSYLYAVAAIVLVSLFVINPFSQEKTDLLALNQDLNEDLLQLDESIQTIQLALDDELMPLDADQSLGEDISNISADINQLLDEF
ncbi:MAG: hypothetical protein KDD94_11720 [Calditrichaeota bacterium]|nr:hypothetical protein [Calditrichota bacterium]